jgi:hypothetical protein
VRLGVGLALEFGVGECVALLDAVAPAEELAPPLAVPPEAVPPEAVPPEAAPLAAPLAALPLAPPLAVPLAADEVVPVGGGTVPEPEDGEQPANAAEARMAKTPKRTAASFGVSAEPAITRTVM